MYISIQGRGVKRDDEFGDQGSQNIRTGTHRLGTSRHPTWVGCRKCFRTFKTTVEIVFLQRRPRAEVGNFLSDNLKAIHLSNQICLANIFDNFKGRKLFFFTNRFLIEFKKWRV